MVEESSPRRAETRKLCEWIEKEELEQYFVRCLFSPCVRSSRNKFGNELLTFDYELQMRVKNFEKFLTSYISVYL